MFLSTLLVNVGGNPDRPRPGRHWLRNPYHVHQRLCMAFPTPVRKADDPQFVAPYSPEGFGAGDGGREQDVHVERDSGQGFLFRIDVRLGGSPVIVVQSGRRPDWEYAFQNNLVLLAALPQVQPLAATCEAGSSFRFRLRANPTCKKTMPDGRKLRVGISTDDLRSWMERKAGESGFRLLQFEVADEGMKRAWKGAQELVFRSALFEGRLEVTDAAKLWDAVSRGIGAGKGLGFGLLSLARE
ncbi:MAG: type I-E CRISPR-associated protein Cas6/Cse3/CasE [Planctomycetia bacterium]|nr:type I-E CRISPR-associated protein Cas6/Cse3/CasE [Planctomycetia bacterium]